MHNIVGVHHRHWLLCQFKAARFVKYEETSSYDVYIGTYICYSTSYSIRIYVSLSICCLIKPASISSQNNRSASLGFRFA